MGRTSAAALATVLAGAAIMTAASPAAAHSEPVQPPPIVRSTDSAVKCWEGSDRTGEAFINSCLFRRSSDGAHYVDLYVWDNNPGNGKCARAAVEWRHDNGSSYYDPPSGLTNCSASWVGGVYGARNQTNYQWVRPTVWIQGDSATLFSPYYF
ncbi:hypothetical protein ACIBI9_65900 [Nonomuraea sp. NPDC050451]|uniref:hypothetical protein n=1 Tax=Nonomuraea sp. NPDC050451 TaxID=3364364 RepID=UPI00378BAF86